MTKSFYRVLLIEDNAVDARLIQLLLAEATTVRFELECAERLSTGLSRLEQGGIDAVLLDLSLPDSLGMDTFQRVYAADSSVPVVVLSGHDDEQLALQAVHEGAQDYLVKGRDDGEVLVRAIRYAIERFRALERLRQREQHLRLLTEQLPAVFWTTDQRLQITSSAGTGRTGWDPPSDEFVGRTLYEYFQTPNSDVTVIAAHHQALQGQPRSFDMRRDGRMYHVQVEPFRGPDGRIIGTIGVALDITDQMLVQMELRMARQIQEGLQPKSNPQLAGFDIAGASFAADAAGGDFFDYFPLSDGTLGVAIGDVGGHGLGPAMLMCQTRAYLRGLGHSHHDVSQMLELANHFLCEDNNQQRLVALMLGKLDAEARTFIYAAAGHRAYLLRRAGEVELLEHTGIPLNILPEAVIAGAPAVPLHSGDLLLLFTDGIIECAGADGTQFGTQRMLDAVRTHRQQPASQILDKLFEAVRQFAKPQPEVDDMTAVVIQVQ